MAQACKLKNGEIAAFVLPQFVNRSSQLSAVKNEYNGVIIESSLADKQFFYGKGAGGFPTASAVLSDLSALRYNYRYEYKKLRYQAPAILATDFYLKVCVSFKSPQQLPRERFKHILEWSSNESRCHITGIIHFSELANSDWWKQPDISVIAYPESVTDNYTLHKLEHRVLEVAEL